LEGYGKFPAYRAVLDLEGASGPTDIAIVDDEDSVSDQLTQLFENGATDFEAILCGIDADRRRTRTYLAEFRRGS
jgi:hypothetical protein